MYIKTGYSKHRCGKSTIGRLFPLRNHGFSWVFHIFWYVYPRPLNPRALGYPNTTRGIKFPAAVGTRDTDRRERVFFGHLFGDRLCLQGPEIFSLAKLAKLVKNSQIDQRCLFQIEISKIPKNSLHVSKRVRNESNGDKKKGYITPLDGHL